MDYICQWLQVLPPTLYACLAKNIRFYQAHYLPRYQGPSMEEISSKDLRSRWHRLLRVAPMPRLTLSTLQRKAEVRMLVTQILEAVTQFVRWLSPVAISPLVLPLAPKPGNCGGHSPHTRQA